MKRFVSPEEAAEIITNITGIPIKLTTYKNASYDYGGTFDSPYFAPLEFTMTSKWILDQHLLPVCPLQQTKPVHIAIATEMPLGEFY